MRHLIAIFICTTLLVSLQAANACCEAEQSTHAHVESADNTGASSSDPQRISIHSNDEHQHPPCGCLCHKLKKSPDLFAPTTRNSDQDLPAIAITLTTAPLPAFTLPQSNAPPVARNISLPPPSNAVFLTQYCRFLL